jgi:hypothetical protein
VQTEHVKYDIMDYIAGHLNAQEHNRVQLHLHKCAECHDLYDELSTTSTALKQNNIEVPSSVYYSTILPRVKERIAIDRRKIWGLNEYFARILLPLAVSVLFVIILIKIPTGYFFDYAQTEALHQEVMDLNGEEVVQAIEKEYAGSSISPNLEVASVGVAAHMQGDQFLKSALSKQIENNEVADMDVDEMMSDLNKEQIDQVLSGLTDGSIL